MINDYRRELKPRIIATATEMFHANGIRAVKMDDIAHQLTISKRTLYEIYPNKEELVMECITTHVASTEKAFREMIPADTSTMDILILFVRNHMNSIAQMNPVLYDELMNYPRMKVFMQQHHAKNAENTKRFFRRAIDEGYFLPDTDIEVIHSMSEIIKDQLRVKRLHNDFSMERIFRVSVNMFIRGFCTMKGVEMLDKALSEMK